MTAPGPQPGPTPCSAYPMREPLFDTSRLAPCHAGSSAHTSGRGAAWLARLLWEQEVGGSNPPAPTRAATGMTPFSNNAFPLRRPCPLRGRPLRPYHLTLPRARLPVALYATPVPPGARRLGSSRLSEYSRNPRGCSSMVELQPSKLVMGVRFPSPAPISLRSKVGGL
jgi:hypothetical protein